MSIMIDGPISRFAGLKHAAYWTKMHCDTTLRIDKERAIKHYEKFLKYRIKNPTIADIAFQEVIGKNGLFCPTHFEKNVKTLHSDPGITGLFHIVQEKIKNLYPKTKNIRKKLIENNRFRLESVTPKMNKLQKLLFKI